MRSTNKFMWSLSHPKYILLCLSIRPMNPLIMITSVYIEIMSVQLNLWLFGHCLCFLSDAEISGIIPKTLAEPSEQQ